jgi:microsomal dipeptidase-like Zn-dependent dipeptidase
MKKTSLFAGLCLLALAATALAAPPVLPPDAKVKPAPKLVPGKLFIPPPAPKLRGFADLHVHPATHFAFGADASGNGGPFWGKPGVKLSDDPLRDMPACSADKHGGFDADPVRHETQKTVISSLESVPGFRHTANGAGSFASWPNARSRTHQTMHITWLKRAYDGGLRFVVASTTDSQLLARFWRHGFNVSNVGLTPADATFDFESAKRQIAFIRKQAAENASWMTIVQSAAEARAAIASGKLAVVLGVELDTLSNAQVLELVRNHGVRSVIPIHLTNNSFGGAAVYDDLFNSANKYVNGRFFDVVGDPRLSTRLSTDPQQLSDPGGLMGFVNAVLPASITRAEYCRLGYECCAENPARGCLAKSLGHKNKLGLTPTGSALLKELMKAGVLIDVAHMGEATTEGAIRLAEASSYPLMDSHTGLRDESRCGHTERSLALGHARRIARLGGVLGLGAEGDLRPISVVYEEGTPVVRFTGDMKSKTFTAAISAARPNVAERVRFEIRTGGDDLRGGNDNAFAVLFLRNGEKRELPLNDRAGWGNNSSTTVVRDLPGSVLARDIERIGVRTTFGGGLGGDNWNMDRIRADLFVNGKWQTVLSRSGAPLIRFTGSNKEWGDSPDTSGTESTCAGEVDTNPNRMVSQVAISIRTGGDDLRGGNDNAFATVELRGGRKVEVDLNLRQSFANGLGVTRFARLPSGTRASDVLKITLRTTFGGGVGGDNWNVDKLRVELVSDPLPAWVEGYTSAGQVFSGIALGTDINGLAPQIPFSDVSVRYPLTLARELGVVGASDLPQHRVGTKTFDLREDGVAHIGMEPELMQALAQLPGGRAVVEKLFDSADATVVMWERAEAAAPRVR